MKGKSASKIKLTSYDELVGGGEETNDIQQVALSIYILREPSISRIIIS